MMFEKSLIIRCTWCMADHLWRETIIGSIRTGVYTCMHRWVGRSMKAYPSKNRGLDPHHLDTLSLTHDVHPKPAAG